MTVPPDALKKGDLISYKGNAAEVLAVRSWNDNLYGKVYGVDLLVKGKGIRASFTSNSQIEVLNSEAA